MPKLPRPRGKDPRYDYSQRASGPSDTSQGGFFDRLNSRTRLWARLFFVADQSSRVRLILCML